MQSKASINNVITNGFCIGCGACTYPQNSPFKILLNEYGQFRAKLLKEEDLGNSIKYSKVCPFSNESIDETSLAKKIFADCIYDDIIGYHIDSYAGYVVNNVLRSISSSGGMTTWIISELLSKKLIDGVFHVKESNNGLLFEYSLSTTIQEIQTGSKTRYYPIEMSSILETIKHLNGKYAIVGLPCFIKSIRLLQNEYPELKEKISYCIGLVCGHLKSSYFADLWAWQLDIHPKDMTTIDFRTKLTNYSANNYGVTVKSKNKKKVSPPLHDLYGSNWGWGFFKYKACDACDDIFSECADITLGDAWLPEYVNDRKGTNIIIARNQILNNLLVEGVSNKTLKLTPLKLNKIKESQSSGIFHRRDALAYRLSIAKDNNEWVPIKRNFDSIKKLTQKQKNIQNLRVLITKQSTIVFHEALKINSFEYFIEQMNPLTNKYQALYKQTLFDKCINKLKRFVNGK